ncbi:HDIG domain protein [Desulfosarcina ovata subsp. sediminis]|uniref:HDIG domain protein n=1 Tax=Desulfosarcina ovata subsp. sediminis TaxID=885957 RepID=A0A5K7ZTF9_9BACT|nr:HDOD domain-containing protein [Desulfosarcina ovata]BBO83503.1 HDIG domain protein [Desulfosarcina ovata subsp. sediminis]
MTDLPGILKKVNNLEPIPTVIHKVLALAGDPDASLRDLMTVVERDPAITANLLKTVNSAHMGLPVKVDSVHQAVSMLGQQKVVEMVLSQNLSTNLNHSQEGYGLAKGDLWRQSLAVAMVARTLAKQRDLMSLPAIYTAALLKDIGKVILHEYVADQLETIQQMVSDRGMSFVEAENEVLGMDHAALGGIIAKQWQFSPHMIYMIENHHLANVASRNDPATAAIYLADMVAMMVDTGLGVDRLAYHVYQDVFNDFFADKTAVREMMLSYKTFQREVNEFMDSV